MRPGAPRPEIGGWYRNLEKGGVFQVVDVDTESAVIETQAFGGDLDQIDLDVWPTLPLTEAEPPLASRTQPPRPLDLQAWDDTRNEHDLEGSESADGD